MVITFGKNAVRPFLFVFMLLTIFIFICTVMTTKEAIDAYPHGSNAETGTIQREKNSNRSIGDYGNYVMVTMTITDKHGNSETSMQKLPKEYMNRFLGGEVLKTRYFKDHPDRFRLAEEKQPDFWNSSLTTWLVVFLISASLFWVSLKLN